MAHEDPYIKNRALNGGGGLGVEKWEGGGRVVIMRVSNYCNLWPAVSFHKKIKINNKFQAAGKIFNSLP